MTKAGVVIRAFLMVTVVAGASFCGEADAASVPGGNWHQWRGPQANGVAPGSPPVRWDEKTNIKWKIDLPGEGSSTPIIWEGQVFILAAVPTARRAETALRPDSRALTRPPGNYYRFQVMSFDRESGRLQWLRTAVEAVPHEGRHPTHSYAAASPVTDGRHLYVSFGSRGIFCYDLEGRLKWSRDLGDMRTRYGWGEASSPVLAGDHFIVNWDHEDQSFIVSLDPLTGAVQWQVEREEPTSWATPLVARSGQATQVIVNGTTRTRSYNAETGGVIWECGGQTLNVIPSPVLAGERVICMSGYKGHAVYAISLEAKGDVTGGPEIAWSYDRGTPYVPSPVLYQNRLYFTLANSGVLTCLDADTGKVVLAEERLPELRTLYASPVAAGGSVYFVDREGTALVLKAGPALETVATNKLDAAIDASPAIAGDQLFLRGRTRLYCIEHLP